jgi:hypothetical protein
VVVTEDREAPARHLVAKVVRPVVARDLRGVEVPQAEVTRAPGDLLALLDETRRAPGHGFLPRRRPRPPVEIEVPREVEAERGRRADLGHELQGRHALVLAAPVVPRSDTSGILAWTARDACRLARATGLGRATLPAGADGAGADGAEVDGP